MSNDNEHPELDKIVRDIDEHFIHLMAQYKLTPLDIASLQLARQSRMMLLTEGVEGLDNYAQLVDWHSERVYSLAEDFYEEQAQLDSLPEDHSAVIIPFRKKDE